MTRSAEPSEGSGRAAPETVSADTLGVPSLLYASRMLATTSVTYGERERVKVEFKNFERQQTTFFILFCIPDFLSPNDSDKQNENWISTC